MGHLPFRRAPSQNDTDRCITLGNARSAQAGDYPVKTLWQSVRPATGPSRGAAWRGVVVEGREGEGREWCRPPGVRRSSYFSMDDLKRLLVLFFDADKYCHSVLACLWISVFILFCSLFPLFHDGVVSRYDVISVFSLPDWASGAVAAVAVLAAGSWRPIPLHKHDRARYQLFARAANSFDWLNPRGAGRARQWSGMFGCLGGGPALSPPPPLSHPHTHTHTKTHTHTHTHSFAMREGG